MKKIVILLVLGLILITGCSKDDSMRLESISMKQVYDISENIEKYPDYVIVDVRSVEEYRSGHIKNAVNVPLPNIKEIDIPKDKKVIVYCRSGSRSLTSAGELHKLGYKYIYNMGGILDWEYELVKE